MAALKTKTFYLIRPDGQLQVRESTFYFPLSRRDTAFSASEREQLPWDSVRNATFKNGFFETQDPDVIWWLEHYHTGGMWHAWKPDESFMPASWYQIGTITDQDPSKNIRSDTKEVERVVEKIVIPRAIVEGIQDVKTLQDTLTSLGIDITEHPNTREGLIKVLEDKWMLK